MSIFTVRDVLTPSSKQVVVAAIGNDAVLVVAANPKRMMINISLPCDVITRCIVLAATEAEANALTGETIGQNFIGNDNRFVPEKDFDSNKGSQSSWWARTRTGIAATTLDVTEYIG